MPLLPSLAWHAAQTCDAMACAFAVSAFAASFGWAEATAAMLSSRPAATSALARIILESPDRKGRILLEFPPSGMPAFAQAQFLRAAGRPADFPPAGPPEVAFAGRSN